MTVHSAYPRRITPMAWSKKQKTNVLQVTDVSQRNSSSGTSGSASSPSSGVSSQLTGSHPGNTGSSQAALAAQLVGQQLLMHGPLGALSPQEIQALASTLQQQQQSLQQQLQQFAMFQQANPSAAGQLPAQAQFFLQNQVSPISFWFFFSSSSVLIFGHCPASARSPRPRKGRALLSRIRIEGITT